LVSSSSNNNNNNNDAAAATGGPLAEWSVGSMVAEPGTDQVTGYEAQVRRHGVTERQYI
jgi:hypothetical protein